MSQTYSPPGPATSRVPILLLAVWGLMTLAAVALVFTCAPNAPAEKEWGFVGVLLGKEPVGPWVQHDLDRSPLARLLYYAEFRLTRDFRACMLLQVAMVSALCLGLMRLAANLRGRPDWADLFFPISLLHVGHWENLLLGYQIRFALFLVFASGLVAVALRTRRETAFRSGVLGGVLLILIALTGWVGVVLALPVAAWLIYLATIIGRNEGRAKAAIVGSLAIVGMIYLCLDFIGSVRSDRHPPLISDPLKVIAGAGQALAMALGVGVSHVWWAVAAAEAVLGAVTIAWLVRRGRNPDHRPSSLGLIAVAVGAGAVTVAFGIGLDGSGDNVGLRSRYSFLMWPLLGAAYLVWVQAGRKWIPIGLCIASALAFLLNTGAGMTRAAGIVSAELGFEIDLHAGIPDDVLIHTHFPRTRNDGQQEHARWAIPMLREAHIGPFAPAGADTSRLGWVAVEVLAAAVVARWLWNLGRAVQAERARELFRLQHERFEEQLLAAAAATGLPRGLRWVSCSITGNAVLVRDAIDAGIVALVPVLLQFEPIEGSDMEQVSAAREPRPATAVFTFARGSWQTVGRIVFNHTPEQTVAKFAPRYRVIQHGQH